MDAEEQALQREGFVAAFRSPVVHDAIRKGALGRVAVIYMEWAGSVTQQVVVPWTIIEDSGGASQLADQLAAAPIRRAPRTSISAAIDYSVLLLEGSGVEAARRVIDDQRGWERTTKGDPSQTPGTRHSTGGSSSTVFRSCLNEVGIGTSSTRPLLPRLRDWRL